MRYDDDLYDDYSDGSFDEPAAIADVIQALKPAVVSEARAEAELERVDWDVDVAVANLRKRQKPATKPQTSKPQEAKGKLTPLQILVHGRKAAGTVTGETTGEDHKHTKTGEKAKETNMKLSQLAAQRRSAVPKDAKVEGLSALDRLRMRQREVKPATTEKEVIKDISMSQSPTLPPQSVNLPVVLPVTPPVAQKWEPQISFEAVQSISMRPPSILGEVMCVVAGVLKHRKSGTNSLATAQNAATAFSKPSPDDRVLGTQAVAFEPKEPKKEIKVKEVKKSDKSVKLIEKNDLANKIGSLTLKPSCSFVVIGHVDAGKSTLMGRLLLDTGALSPKIVEKFERESARAGKASFWLAWALDATTEERERGVTVDVGEANFETMATKFTVLDAPGHRDYVPNMIAGVSQADLAVLVVDSDTNAFESGFSLDGQTKEHAVLARSLGLDRIVVAVNKMDTQNWSEDRFHEISAQLTDFLTKKVGFASDQIVYVPTSGITRTNVVIRGDNCPQWYQGPTLVESLDSFARSKTDKQAFSEPLRFMISNAFTEPFQSTVTVTGRVLTGCIEANDVVELVAQRDTAKVKSLNKEFLTAGEPGELKLQLDGVDDVSVRPGDVLAGAGANLKPVTRFIAKVRLFDVPRPVLPGTKLSFHLGRVDDMVTVVNILVSLSSKKIGKVRHLGKSAAARVELELANPAILAPTNVCKDLGRFVLRLNGVTVGGGVIESIEPSDNLT